MPSDLGFDDDGFILPAMNIHQSTIKTTQYAGGTLFAVEAKTLAQRREARRSTIEQRVQAASDLVAREPDEQWLLWCDLNAESEALARAIPGAVEVKGSDTNEHKEAAMLGFAAGDVRVLVTKPSIAGFGMNWQSCAKMIFVGLSDSYERTYQAIRRCWRFGQDRPVDVYFVTADIEGAVVENVKRKEREAGKLIGELINNMARIEQREATCG